VGLVNLGSKSEMCVGSRVHLVGAFISFEKIFYQLPFTPPLSGSLYWSFKEVAKNIARAKLDHVSFSKTLLISQFCKFSVFGFFRFLCLFFLVD
jgi:hypothetical protein